MLKNVVELSVNFFEIDDDVNDLDDEFLNLYKESNTIDKKPYSLCMADIWLFVPIVSVMFI